MRKQSDFNNAVTKYPNIYASNPVQSAYIAPPSQQQQIEGRSPMDTLPAQWWNWLWNVATTDINAFKDYVGDSITELNTLLTNFGITLDSANTQQLYDFFHDTYTVDYLQTLYVKKSGDTVDGDLHIKGDLIVDGTGEEIISTELKVGANTITLRNGNPSALGNTELAGVVVENYDGLGTNNIISVGKDGVARTGDINIATRLLYSNDRGTTYYTDEECTIVATIGTNEEIRDTGNTTEDNVEIYEGITYSNNNTQPFATREENPIDGGFAKWDSSSKKFVTTQALEFLEEFNHNVPRKNPKDITAYYQDGTLWDRIHGTNGYHEFQDIYVGDYFQMNNTICKNGGGGTSTGTKWVTVAGINTKMNQGDSESNALVVNHLVLVPGKGGERYEEDGTTPINQNFGSSYMNSTNTTSGAYLGSYMKNTIIGNPSTTASTTGTISQQLYNEFGTHLIETRELLPTSSAAGNPTGWSWTSCTAVLMTEIEVYGSRVWGQSGWDIGTGNTPLPLFQYITSAKNNRNISFWLREVSFLSVSTAFCWSDNGGFPCAGSAGFVCGVRPRFIIS